MALIRFERYEPTFASQRWVDSKAGRLPALAGGNRLPARTQHSPKLVETHCIQCGIEVEPMPRLHWFDCRSASRSCICCSSDSELLSDPENAENVACCVFTVGSRAGIRRVLRSPSAQGWRRLQVSVYTPLVSAAVPNVPLAIVGTVPAAVGQR